jgi:hypothetical protein
LCTLISIVVVATWSRIFTSTSTFVTCMDDGMGMGGWIIFGIWRCRNGTGRCGMTTLTLVKSSACACAEHHTPNAPARTNSTHPFR